MKYLIVCEPETETDDNDPVALVDSMEEAKKRIQKYMSSSWYDDDTYAIYEVNLATKATAKITPRVVDITFEPA